jgi:hypothetical protein
MKLRTGIFPALALLVIIATMSDLAVAAKVTARLDRNKLVQGETVTLILQTDDPRQSVEPSLSVLDKDFAVLDRRSETQMSIVNGEQTAVVRLMVTLEPLRAGDLIIPPLRVGTQTTQPISLHVDPPPDPEPGATQAVFIEVELNPEEGPYYVHAQLGLTVRVFYQQNLTEAAISQPEPTQASLRLLDEVPFQAERNGQRYRVLERHYAVFPERSGELTIPPLQLTGRLVERRSDRLWQPTVRGRRIRVESDQVSIDVQPKPATFSGSSWQPARTYSLSQKISDTDGIRVGEPVTRTIIIDAVGLEENMIAEPQWPELNDVRIYPDQPQGISRDDGAWVLGHKEFRYAVVPESTGTLVLPEISVVWWDTVNDVERTSVLVASTIEVLPSALDTVIPQPVAAAPSGQAQDIPITNNVAAAPSYWRWLTYLFAILWLLTLVFAVRKKGTPGRSTAQAVDQQATEKDLLQTFKRACIANDAGAARKALQQWLAVFGPDAAGGSLLRLASMSGDAALQDELYALDAVGFQSGAGSGWAGRTLWQHFSGWHKRAGSAGNGEPPSPIDLYAKENRAA